MGERRDLANPEGRFGRDTSVAATGPVGPGCTVVFDADRSWSETSGSGPSLHQAAVHEIGHVLGLGHTEDPASVLHPQRENGRTRLAPADLAGLHSLYGGGSEGPGDLVIEAARPVPALRRVAPPEMTAWVLFDTDGDGDEEVLVWATGARAAGVLTVYHFSEGPLLERSVGPHLGIGGHGARVLVGRAPDGERCIDVAWPDSTYSRWSFGTTGCWGSAPDFGGRPPQRTWSWGRTRRREISTATAGPSACAAWGPEPGMPTGNRPLARNDRRRPLRLVSGHGVPR